MSFVTRHATQCKRPYYYYFYHLDHDQHKKRGGEKRESFHTDLSHNALVLVIMHLTPTGHTLDMHGMSVQEM